VLTCGHENNPSDSSEEMGRRPPGALPLEKQSEPGDAPGATRYVFEAPLSVCGNQRVLGLSLLLLACSDPTIVPIARGAGGGDESNARAPRGRVEVVDGRLVTDMGSILRGVTSEADLGVDFEPYASPEAARPLLRAFFERLTSELGLNALQVYLEGWDVATGSRAEFADVLVEESGRAGAYLLVGPGAGPVRDGRGGTGWFDPAVVSAFWSFYAGRYADRTHVIYQLQKVPDRTCDGLWSEDALELEQSVHAIIRAQAPDTHIVMFSFASTPTASAFDVNVRALDGLEWHNASVGFHAHDECVPISEVSSFPRDLDDGRRISLLSTELPPEDWQANLLALETESIGWMHYHWLELDSELSDFRSAHDDAGASWCPDFGTWPTDSSSCSRP
jgi:hypothetical protein